MSPKKIKPTFSSTATHYCPVKNGGTLLKANTNAAYRDCQGVSDLNGVTLADNRGRTTVVFGDQ